MCQVIEVCDTVNTCNRKKNFINLFIYQICLKYDRTHCTHHIKMKAKKNYSFGELHFFILLLHRTRHFQFVLFAQIFILWKNFGHIFILKKHQLDKLQEIQQFWNEFHFPQIVSLVTETSLPPFRHQFRFEV